MGRTASVGAVNTQLGAVLLVVPALELEAEDAEMLVTAAESL